MPRQNRVDPFGNIVANPAYGLLMGNRGCLHDDDGRIIRAYDRDAWITCQPTWPGVHRTLMAPRHYTELFFLDEATAMAAGHRPCGSCRPDELRAFKGAWRRAFRLDHELLVGEIDVVLRTAPQKTPIWLHDLADGVMISVDGAALLRWKARWVPWSFEGYGQPTLPNASWAPTLVTSTPMIEILRAGYVPLVHSTADAAVSRRAGSSSSPSAAAACEGDR